MKELNEARKTYEDTPIPEALGFRVQEGIRQGRARYRARRSRVIRRWSAAAACFCLVLAGLNLSPTVAQAAAEVPVMASTRAKASPSMEISLVSFFGPAAAATRDAPW